MKFCGGHSASGGNRNKKAPRPAILIKSAGLRAYFFQLTKIMPKRVIIDPTH